MWVRLGSLYEVNPKNKADDELDAAFIPMEKISAGMLSEYSYETQEWCKAKKGHTQFADGDVAFAKISPCFENRKSMMLNNLPNSIGGGTTELIILRNASIDQKYTFWTVSDERFIRGGVQTYSGTVGQQRINMDYVRSYPIPLPPISEQQRIVERIEELFAKLDEAKERLQEVADSFAVRKAAILHKAFTGELTKQWRRENGVSDESWEESNFGKFTVSQYGYTEKAHWEKVGPKFLRITDIQDNKVNWEEVPWCPIDEAGMKQYAVQIGDIMIARTGATTGKSYLICDDVEAVFASFLIRLKVVDKNLDYNYLYGYMQSEDYWRQITDFSSGIAQPGVNANKLKQIKFKCPSLPEQHEIVRLIDDLLARERAAQQAAEQALASIDLMKKSILARAFRGELGTNKASEASALELLRQVLAEG